MDTDTPDAEALRIRCLLPPGRDISGDAWLVTGLALLSLFSLGMGFGIAPWLMGLTAAYGLWSVSRWIHDVMWKKASLAEQAGSAEEKI